MAIILVVEDELLLSWDISEALEGEGYDVIAVANADEAIKVLESRNDIRTIFTDIDLPGSMDGLKLARAVRDRWPPVHIIVTTGMRAPHRDEMPANSASSRPQDSGCQRPHFGKFAGRQGPSSLTSISATMTDNGQTDFSRARIFLCHPRFLAIPAPHIR